MYKTIMLELLQQHPELHEQLRKSRALLPALEHYASELKALHQAWKDTLSQAKPGSGESQTASEALEMAIQEIEARLPTASPLNDNDPLSLEAAMAFIRLHTPPA